MLVDPPSFPFEHETCMVATWRSIVMPVMGKHPIPPASAQHQVQTLEAFGKRLGKGKMAEISIIANDAPLPEAETRAVLDKGVPIVSPFYACVGAVYEGTGFRAALVRGILTSFQLLSRSKYPQRTFSSVEECARWIFPLLAPLGMVVASADEIVEAVEAVRAYATSKGVL